MKGSRHSKRDRAQCATYLGLFVFGLAVARGVVGGSLTPIAEFLRLLLQTLLFCFELRVGVDGALVYIVIIVVASPRRRRREASSDPESCVVVLSGFQVWYVVLGVGGMGGVRESCKRARVLFSFIRKTVIEDRGRMCIPSMRCEQLLEEHGGCAELGEYG